MKRKISTPIGILILLLVSLAHIQLLSYSQASIVSTAKLVATQDLRKPSLPTQANTELGKQTLQALQLSRKLLDEFDLNSTDKTKIKNDLAKTLNTRKILLLSLMKTNPENAFNYLFPEESIEQLNEAYPDLTTNIEQPIEIDGTLEIDHADFLDSGSKNFVRSETYNFLKTNDNKKYRLHLSHDNELEEISGSKIRTTGFLLGDEILVSNNEVTFSQLPGHSVRKTAAFVFTWSDMPNPNPCLDLERIRARVFGPTLSARSYYLEASFQKLVLEGYNDPVNGDVFGVVTIPYSSADSCNYSAWATAA